MIRRIVSLLAILWFLGLALFSVTLPGPAAPAKSDGIIVLTGGKGRIERGVVLMQANQAQRMLVSGVDPLVKSRELAAVLKAPPKLFACCIDLGKDAIDTRTNAEESARWMKANKFKSVRLVTTDWHMPRARFELERELDSDITIITDAVPSAPGLMILVREYNKYWLRRISAVLGV